MIQFLILTSTIKQSTVNIRWFDSQYYDSISKVFIEKPSFTKIIFNDQFLW